MQSKHEKQKVAEDRKTTATQRFKIEQLEERIAPHHRIDHYKGGHDWHPCGRRGCY